MYKRKYIKTLNTMSQEPEKISCCSIIDTYSLMDDYHENRSFYDYCKNSIINYMWMLRYGLLKGVFDSKYSIIKIERKHIGYDNLAILPEYLYEDETKLSKMSQTF